MYDIISFFKDVKRGIRQTSSDNKYLAKSCIKNIFVDKKIKNKIGMSFFLFWIQHLFGLQIANFMAINNTI